MLNKINEIRELLGDEYHLSVIYDPEEPQWVLYRNYLDTQVYFSEDNEAIMSSKTNTYDELYKFAKEHHKVDGFKIELYTYQIIAVLMFILNIVNFKIKIEMITGFIYGVDLMIIVGCLIKAIVFNKNDKVDMRNIQEQVKRNIERINK